MRRSLMVTAAAAALVMCASSAADAATGWAIQTTPNVSGVAHNELYGVSCPATANCIAVGEDYNPGGASAPLAEQWNGSTWAIQSVPLPTGAVGAVLEAVSCASASDCTAVGWSATSSDAVSTLAEQWNGSTWTVESTPTRSKGETELLGVSCPSANVCVAVGTVAPGSNTPEGLIDRWNGSTWKAQTVAKPAGVTHIGLQGVSCTSGTNCTAVGSYFQATEDQAPLAEQWNGSTWTVQSTPSLPGSDNTLSGVSCRTATSCTAVGADNISGQFESLAEQWNGSTWTVATLPSPAGSKTGYLNGVSCPSARNCTAVGSYTASGQSGRLLVEHWTGSTWLIQRAPVPAGSHDYRYFDDVSCATTAGCTAIGYYSTNGFETTDLTLAEAN
jgi:hypothetical protein